MKHLNRILTNQIGMSLVMVLVTVTLALGAIGYITTELVPKLQDGKKKAEQAIQYRIFIGSLNDYLVHGIRERWCITAGAESSAMTGGTLNSGYADTDMLIANSTACASTQPMESVVKFKGNLERILWDAQTTGADGETNPIYIIGLNHVRRTQTSPKTNVVLTQADVMPLDYKMKFRISEATFNNMSNLHPLYTISQGLKGCFNHVDIEIEQIQSGPGAPVGDEKKIKIEIEADIKMTRIACLAHKRVKSTSFYTFYPRRLHNFALIKYDDLDAGKYNEFYGPVYLAGNLKLPADATGKAKSSIFYDSLTLGTFNGGTYRSGVYYAGKIKNSEDTPYTFSDHGDPYKSKQDSYETFRGILGGLRLDAVEDKGMYNIFDYTSANTTNVATLEACIDDNKIKTTPSMTAGTILAYSNVSANQSSNPGTISFKIGFNKKNRFKPSLNAPGPILNPADTNSRKFMMDVPTSPNGVKAIGLLKFTADSGNDFSATLGDNTSVEFKIEFAKYGLTDVILDAAITALNLSTSSKATYQDVLPAGHMLRMLPEYANYKDKTEDLLDKCDQPNKASIAHCLTPFPPDYASVTCDHTTDPQCNQSSRYSDYLSGKLNLKNKLDAIRTALVAPGDAQMTISLASFLNTNTKMVINQKSFQLTFTDKWKYFYPMLHLTPIIEFVGYHYGTDVLSFRIETVDSNLLAQLKRQDNGNLVNFSNFSNWKNTYDNGNLPYTDYPEELTELDCPTGMGFADWDLDMSGSSNFAWNYANVPAGLNIDITNHDSVDLHTFYSDPNTSGHYSGFDDELTKSVVNHCKVGHDREYVYGFYACRKLTIESGRTRPLNMIGTFIVRDLENLETNQPVRWHSLWTPIARDLVLNQLHAPNVPNCADVIDLSDKTLLDILTTPGLEGRIKKCSSQELVSNGPNNFTWTTVDPEIGIDPEHPAMTSQKVRRHSRWVMREDSRKDLVK